jgi:hypothetical protein
MPQVCHQAGTRLLSAAGPQQIGQSLRVTRFKNTLVIIAQQAEVAIDARGQYRRAAADGLHQHMRATFQPAGVHQQVRALDTLQSLRVRQSAQPAVVRALCLCGLSRLAKSRVQRSANVVNEDAAVCGQQPCSVHQRQGVFFIAQVADHHHAQMAWGFGQGLTLARGLENHPRLGLVRARQGLAAKTLQHHQRGCQGQGLKGFRVLVDVTVQVGAGQGQAQTLWAVLCVPGLH